MNKKNLPIKIFQKRKKVDDRKTEGMGNNELPDWAQLTPEQLTSRTFGFKKTLSTISEALQIRNKERDFIPAVIQLELHEDATAKSHRGDVVKMFNVNDQLNVIGFTNERNLLVKINNERDISEINKALSNSLSNAKGIASITELVKFQPRINVAKQKKSKIDDPLRVSLINYHNYQLNESVSNEFERFCKELKINFKKTNYSTELIIYRLSDVTADSLEEIKEFEALEAISLMPKYSIDTDELTAQEGQVEIKSPQKGKNYPIVGVLDTGIKDIPQLKPWILKDKFMKIAPDMVDASHGTFVAGIIVYGDSLQSNEYVGHDGCFLFDATIHPGSKDEIEEFELVEHIREAIDLKYKEIKIWNLSLGTKNEADNSSFSYFGQALDQIQERYGVVICKSAGNCTNFMVNKPVQRIAKSADSIRSLVIGSIAHEKGKYDIAEINHRSPFSRIGKAPAFINKPELTHIGGNAGIDPKTNKLVISGIRSFTDNGLIATKIGTSFSTPRVSSLVAELENRIDEEFNPLLIKALAIHSAKYPQILNIPNSEKLISLGYGIPQNADDILFNDPYEITLILQDTLIKGNWIEIADFPFPTNMTENGFYYGEITVTLVSSPILSESQGAEYCQSNLEVLLGTYENLKKREGKTIRNEIGLDEPMNLLKPGLFGAKFRKNHIGEFARERVLVKYGDKYQPIKKYAINLEEATESNKVNHLTAPQKWYLQVKGLFRDSVIRQAEKDATELSQEFCLIITIRDNKKRHKVYDLTSKLLNQNGFFHNEINLKSRVKVPIR